MMCPKDEMSDDYALCFFWFGNHTEEYLGATPSEVQMSGVEV